MVCRPADPEAKGLVEWANGYLGTSFLPGGRFASPADFNAQLAEWTATVNGRARRALGCSPAERIAADRHVERTGRRPGLVERALRDEDLQRTGGSGVALLR